MLESTVSKRILVVDDEPSLLEVLSEMAERLGFEPLQASKGIEAYEIGRAEKLALALMDINLPDISGVEVVRRWRSIGIQTPVIFATAEADAGERREAQDLSDGRLLEKPFHREELNELLATLEA